MSATAVLPLLVLACGATGSESYLAFEQTSKAFQAYMSDLDELAQRWQQAAESIERGDADAAKTNLTAPLPENLDTVWMERQNTLHKKARTHRFYEVEWLRQHNCYALGRWHLAACQPGLAAARLESCTPPWQKYQRQEFDQYFAQALFEAGRFAEAADRLTNLKTSGWSTRSLEEHAKWIATLRRYDRDYPNASGPPCEHLELGASSSRQGGELAAVLGVFRCMRQTDAAAMRGILLALFHRVGDETARALLLRLSASDRTQEPKDIAAVLLTLGTDAYAAKDYEAAMRWWQRAVDHYPQTPSWPKALFNIATTLKGQLRYEEAIAAFTHLRDAEVDDRESGAHLMEAYRNYRPKASWQIGLCHLASGEPKRALVDFLNTRDNFPFQSWCGNARWEYAYKYAAYEGICQELLGAYGPAIGAYFRAITEGPGGGIYVNRRLANLYESVGQTDRLLTLCDEVDTHWLREIRRRNPELQAELSETQRPTATVRRLLKIRSMRQPEKGAELMEMIDQKRGFGPDTPGDLIANWQVEEAARTLSHQPKESFELLRQRALAKHPNHRGWLCYAMSVVAPDKAVPFVANELSKATNQHHCATLAFTLQQCGVAGIAAIDQIERRGEHMHHKSVRSTLALRRRSEPNPWPDLPAPPRGTLLPVRMAEVDEKVRILESLPEIVTVDRMTPRATIESWVMALRIADRHAFTAITADDRKLTAIFNDLCDPTGQHDVRLMTYDMAEIAMVDKSQALAQVTLHLGGSDHRLAIRLSQAHDGWRVDAVEESRK